MDNDVFLKISKTIENQKLKKTCLSLAEKFKPTIQSELYRVYNLSMKLYFQNKTEEVLLICNELEQIKFTGNFNIWTPIESTLLLKCRILENKNLNNELENSLSVIKTVDFFEWKEDFTTQINRRVRKRRITERSLLKDEEINEAIKNKEIDEEIELRKIQFSELLFIHFLSDKKAQEIREAILENEKRIKEYIF